MNMKCALDKLRFELTLYGFFSKEETDLIISIVWRSWPPNGGLDEVGGGEPSGEPPLTSSRPSFGPPGPPDNGDNKIAFLFREKSVQC